MAAKTITVVGGTGFVGRQVVRALARAGHRVVVVARAPNAAQDLRTAGDLGQIAIVPGDLARPDTLLPYLPGSDVVINLVGVLFEQGQQKFSTLHALGAERLAQAAKAAGVPAFIHMSALGVDKATTSKYARTKALGEKAVMAAFPGAVVLRPSIIFGPGDNFFNQFAALAGISPVLPLIGGGKSRFQPVYVGDVAQAVARIVDTPSHAGKIYELGGSRVMSMREILTYILLTTGHHCKLVPLPFSLASVAAPFLTLAHRFLPFIPALTHDQVQLLKYDNVVESHPSGLAALSIAPTPVEAVVPDYLSRFVVRELRYA